MPQKTIETKDRYSFTLHDQTVEIIEQKSQEWGCSKSAALDRITAEYSVLDRAGYVRMAAVAVAAGLRANK